VGQRYSLDGKQTFISPSRFDFFTQNTSFPSDFITKAITSNKLNFLTFDGGTKIGTHWDMDGHIWYDVHNHHLRESGLTASYSSQCWGVTANFIDRPGEKQVMVMVNLKGLGTTKL
jgi:lipopolysaccharide assembly outer membrane protein LptD (OstA)